MSPELTHILTTVHDALHRHGVAYMIVGGIAVGIHGYERITVDDNGEPLPKPDIDIWYSPTYDNYWKILNAIEDMGKDMTEHKEENMPEPKRSYFKLDFESYTLDFIPVMPGLSRFADCYTQKKICNVNGKDLFVIGLQDLINNKHATGRAKDMIDIEQLKRFL